MPRWLLAVAGADSSSGSSSEPTVVVGPIELLSVTPLPAYLTPMLLNEIPLGQMATIGVRVVARSDDPSVLSYVGEWLVDIARTSSGLSVLGYTLATPIGSQRVQGLSGWVAELSVDDKGEALSVYGQAPVAPSYWTVLEWTGPLVDLAGSGPVPVLPVITAFALDPNPVSAAVAVTSLAASVSPVDWYFSQNPLLPPSPVWGAPVSPLVCSGTGSQTWYAWARDSLLQITARADANTVVPVGDVNYFVDDFHRANGAVGNGWVAVNSAVGTIASDEMVRTDSGDYRRLQHAGGGALPSDYYLTWEFPAGTQGAWFGVAGRISVDGLSGIQLLWHFDATPTVLFVGAGVLAPTLENITPTVVGAIPASWATGPCALTLQFDGVVGRIFFNGDLYATFDAAFNAGVSGTLIGSVGEGANRHYTAVRVTNYLPGYP